MKKILMISILLLSGAIIFNACDDEEDYDFASYEPVVFSAKGNTAPMQGRHYEYSAVIRGGSTYNWSTAISANVVEGITESNWMVHINFPDIISTTDEPEVVTVTETAYSGKVSDEYTITVDTVAPFTALAIEGSDNVNGGFVSKYSVSPSSLDKTYSTYEWECDKGTLTQDSEEPWKISIAFENEDVGTAELILTETTTTGFVDKDTLEIEVNAYCAVEDFNDFGGVYSGGDYTAYGINGFGDFTVTVTSVEDRTVTISDAFWYAMWGPGYWGETPTSGNAVELTLNLDGTISFDEQKALQTDDEWDYFIGPRATPARWNGCDGEIELYIPYQAYWDDSYEGGFQALILCTKSLGKSDNSFKTRVIEFDESESLKQLPIK